MNNSIIVQNIKCGGCANSIKKKLMNISGITEVDINIEQGIVSWVADADQKQVIKTALSSMGYPEGDSTLLQTAKSYVSCAIGRLDNES